MNQTKGFALIGLLALPGVSFGAVLYGDVKDGPWYFQLIQSGADIATIRPTLLFGEALCASRKKTWYIEHGQSHRRNGHGQR